MINFTNIFVSIFYIGYIRYAPGTWGSLASLGIIFFLFNIINIPLSILIILFVFLFFLSNYLINYFSSITNSHDSKHIVIDYNNYITCLLIFIFFRIFDVFKIFPANYFDKQLHSGYGVILDDIIAGMYTILTMIIINVFI